MKFPRTIQPDLNRSKFPDPIARAGEWAVTGAFRFAHRDPATLHARELERFKHGWLGLDSFGDATIVEIAELDEATYDALIRRLTAHLMTHYGIADVDPAVETALEEMAFAASLATHPVGTRLALDRELNDQGLIEKTRIVD